MAGAINVKFSMNQKHTDKDTHTYTHKAHKVHPSTPTHTPSTCFTVGQSYQGWVFTLDEDEYKTDDTVKY